MPRMRWIRLLGATVLMTGVLGGPNPAAAEPLPPEPPSLAGEHSYAQNAGKGFGVRLGPQVFAAADWASGGMLTDGGLQAAHEVAGAAAESVRLSA